MADINEKPELKHPLADAVLSATEAAALAGAGTDTVRAWLAGDGPRPIKRIGRSYIFAREDVEAYLAARAGK